MLKETFEGHLAQYPAHSITFQRKKYEWHMVILNAYLKNVHNMQLHRAKVLA